MIILKNIDKAIEEIFGFCNKIYWCGTEKGKSEGWKITLESKQFLSWIVKDDSLNAQERGVIPGRGGRIYKKDPCMCWMKKHLTRFTTCAHKGQVIF